MKDSFIKKFMFLILFFFIIGFFLEIAGIGMMLNKTKEETFKNYEDTFQGIINNIIKNDEDILKLRLYDYSVWDDMYNAIDSYDYDWAYENGTGFLYEDEKYEIDAIFVIGSKNDYYEFYGKDGLDKAILDSNCFKYVFETKGDVLSYIKFENEIYRLAISPVFTNDRELSNGYYVMGQKIDENYVESLDKKFLDMDQFLGNQLEKLQSNENLIDIEYDILDFKYELIGSIHYYFDGNPYSSNYNKLFSHTFLITTLLTVTLSILFFCFIRKFQKVFEKIVDEINIVSEGKYEHKIEGIGVKEIDVIVNQVNKLSSKVIDNIENLKNSNLETLEILINLIEEKDKYTRGHSERVMEISLIIGKTIGYSDLDELSEAALLHDIGKIGIEEKILNKAGKLSEEEFKSIMTHPLKGEKILRFSSRMSRIAQIIKEHHERYDGKGYPEKIEGENIELGARIIAVADAFDAMTSERSYRPAKSFGEAVSIIVEERNKQFDGVVVDSFLKSLEKISYVIYEKK